MTNVCVLCVKPLAKYPNNRISYHVFPACPKKRKIWLKQCRLTNKEVLPKRKICSLHFEPSCFKSNVKRRILYPDAVPTIFGTTSQPSKIVKGKTKNCNKNAIAGQNRQSRDTSLTRAAKKGIASSNHVSRDILPTKPASKVLHRVKSNETNRKRKLDKHDEPIVAFKKNKSSFMSLLKLVRIQMSMTNGIK